MLSERIYRWLLRAYPSEHRREYGELMVQLFRDRMRRDGGGYGGLSVWMQMIIDLAGSAYSEHRREPDMTTKMWLVSALVALVLIGTVGVGTLMAQSEDEIVVSVWRSSQTFEGSTEEGIAGVMRQAVEEGVAGMMRQAVEEGAVSQEAADRIVRAVESPDGTQSTSLTGEVVISVLHDSQIFPATGEYSSDADDPVKILQFSFTDEGGFAQAVTQAVDEGVISQEIADVILRAIDEENSES